MDVLKNILFYSLIALTLAGCSPKRISVERVSVEVDSSSVLSLQNELSKKNEIIENLKINLERTKEEIVKLQSETSSHTINYNTNAPLKQDGTYPIASEIKTESKSVTDKIIKDFEKIKSEYERLISEMMSENKNLKQNTKIQTSKNSELEQKTYKSNIWLYVIFYVVGVFTIPIIKMIFKNG